MSPLDSRTGLSGRAPVDPGELFVVDDNPLTVARQNVAAVEGRLVAAQAAYERLHDGRFSDQERDRHEGEIARLEERLRQRADELHALEIAAGLPLTELQDRSAVTERLRFKRDQRARQATAGSRPQDAAQ